MAEKFRNDSASLMLRRITDPFREFGVSAGALYILGRALEKVSPRLTLFVYEFMVQPIPSTDLLPTNLARAFNFRQIRQGDPEIERMPARPQIKKARFDQGAVCLGTFRADTLIGYIWFCFDRYEEDEARCTYHFALPAESVFDFDLFVFPEHRAAMGFAAVWHGANQYLRERGIRYSFSRLTRFNLASRRSHAHLGWKKVSNAVFFRAWNIEIMLAGIRPYLAITLVPKRIELCLSPKVLVTTERNTTNG